MVLVFSIYFIVVAKVMFLFGKWDVSSKSFKERDEKYYCTNKKIEN